MNRLTLNQKLWSIVVLLWVGLFTVVTIMGFMTRSRLLDERHMVLKMEVQMGAATIAYFQKEAADGAMSVDDAKHHAIEALRGTRWGNTSSGSFGIYDSAVNVVLMPENPQLESTNQAAMTGPDGSHVALDIVKSSSDGGSGFTQYLWAKPGSNAATPQLTYSQSIPGWDWHLYTSSSINYIDTAFRSVMLNNLSQVSVIGLLLTIAILWLIRTIRKDLGGEPAYAAQLCQRIASGDLTVPVELHRDDTSSLLHAMVQMQQQLTSTVTGIQSAAESITLGANEIAAGNADLSQRTEEQASALAESASSMDTLTSNVKMNADNATQASRLAEQASSTVADGNQVVGEVVSTMLAIAESSKEIEQIISVIEGIAFQTNILALNAAVEAARAGEQGRGFAVVAAEVRALAQRSAGAAKEIKELIGTSVGNVTRGQTLAASAGDSMQAILTSVRRVTDIMGEISAASADQSEGIAQVGIAISQMDTVTQQNAALVEQAAAAAASLAEQAVHLKQSVSQFRLREA
ncbi:MAG TPA: methyl-accepting chemotaxis protein [Paraburkholderia sp.]|jgi:methyl-accepting chemotaxis protein